LPAFAGAQARAALAPANALKPAHQEDWESAASDLRTQLRRVLGDFPAAPKPNAQAGKAAVAGQVRTTPLTFHPEPDLPVPAWWRQSLKHNGKTGACVLLHLDGKDAALKHPLAEALLEAVGAVLLPDLRGTGETRPANDAVRDAPDHNSAEHSLWVGRPLLGQWVFDVRCLLDWLAARPDVDRDRLSVVGLGQAGLVALCAGGLLESAVAAAAVGAPVSYVTDQPYPAGTRMGLLVPGLLRVGDVPHLAALAAPRRLVIAAGLTTQGQTLADKPLQEAFAFTRRAYQLHKQDKRLRVGAALTPKEVAAALV
jgi:hypothetical protein